MKPAQFAVIRYVADPGRNEALNVGILVWDEKQWRLRIDDLAVERVVRENPHLERDSLLYLQPYLERLLAQGGRPLSNEGILAAIQKRSGMPVLLTEPRFTSFDDELPDGLTVTLDRLNKRIVRPRRRPGGGGFDAVRAFEQRLSPFIQRRIVLPNHFFAHSRTGIPRSVDFFVNSQTNAALDTLQLAVQSADLIRVRADAEAFKIEDVCSQGQNEGIRFVVYCHFSDTQDLLESNENAERVLKSVGARVVNTVDAGVQELGVDVY